MAGIMDDAKDKMSDMGMAAKERYHMLKSKDKSSLTDSERAELDQLRSRFENMGKQ